MDDEELRDSFLEVVTELKKCCGEVSIREKLLDLGFEFFKDNTSNNDEIEEKEAKPQNDKQVQLIAFFESEQESSLAMLKEFLEEINLDEANYFLLRRYLKSSNKQLKKLILYGLKKYPTHRDLLDILASLNEFDLHLRELIDHYVHACRVAEDLKLFEELATDFYGVTFFYDYDALYALKHDENINKEKKDILDHLRRVLAEENSLFF